MNVAEIVVTLERVDRQLAVDPPRLETGVTAKATLLMGPAAPKRAEATEWGHNYHECERQALSRVLRAMAAAMEVLP